MIWGFRSKGFGSDRFGVCHLEFIRCEGLESQGFQVSDLGLTVQGAGSRGVSGLWSGKI